VTLQTWRAKLTPAADFAPGETGFVVTFPEWGWGATQGETEAEALGRAEDALEEMVAAALEDGDELPVPAAGGLVPDERRVAVGAHLAAKAALHQALRSAAVSRAELARRLGLDEREVRRMLDPRHATRLARLEAALRAVCRRLLVVVQDAA
jgi:antitoxin HicB